MLFAKLRRELTTVPYEFAFSNRGAKLNVESRLPVVEISATSPKLDID